MMRLPSSTKLLLLLLSPLLGASEVDPVPASSEDSASEDEGINASLLPTFAPPKHISRKKLVNGVVETYSEEEEPWFLAPKSLEPGQLAPIVWRDDGQIVDSEGFYIGMPPKLTELIAEYLEESGLNELNYELMYEDPVKPGEDRMYRMKDGTEWGVMGPKQWTSGDLTWVDAANEETYELTLKWLRDGDFDVVLNTIGKKFKMDGLMIHGVGIIIVSNFRKSNMHFDIGDTDHKFFNIIFPIQVPKVGNATLKVGDRRGHDEKPTNLRKDMGILLGGQTRHGTGKCNYRAEKDFRVGIAIYMADINEENVETISGDSTSLFPSDDDEKWFMAQAGRVWNKDGSASLKNDKGRKPYDVLDDPKLDCEALAAQGKCETDLKGIRLRCVKTCKVYLQDHVYYDEIIGVAKSEL